MNYKDKLQRRRNGNSNFHNFDAAPLIEQLDPNDKTLTITITTVVTTAAGTVRVFGAIFGDAETFNTANNTSVAVAESSHLEVKRSILADPFRIKGIKVQVTNSAAQFSNPFKIAEESIAGAQISKLWTPLKYKSPRDYDTKLIETRDFQMMVSKGAYIEIPILAGETLTFIVEMSKRLDIANELSNKPILQAANPYSA
jgi:hypothetical protein